jgi:hypothetical protein
MSHRSRKRKPATGRGDGEDLSSFLVRELPPQMTKEAPYLTNAIREAGARYDRYAANKLKWLHYKARRNRLKAIARLAESLGAVICGLDVLSRDDLASRVDPKEIDSLVGSLRLLETVTTDLSNAVQGNGKPRDLAEERWILQLANVYENAFAEPATVSGSGADPTRRHGKFYRLLELSRPNSFPRYGKLTLRQVDRTLKRERKRSRGIIDQAMLRVTGKAD